MFGSIRNKREKREINNREKERNERRKTRGKGETNGTVTKKKM